MKKSILSLLLVSAVTLGGVAHTTKASADDVDSKINEKTNEINKLKDQEAGSAAQVSEIEGNITSINAKRDALKKENEQLLAESKKLNKEISDLQKDIKERDEALQEQARSAQTDSNATNYISAIVNSKSISDAVTRVTAMRQVMGANDKMMKEQQAAKAEVEEKLSSNIEKSKKAAANQNELEVSAKSLDTQKAELKVAQLNLSLARATAEGDKEKLVAEKAAAEEAAKKAAAEEKARQEREAQEAQAAAEAQKQAEAQAATEAAAKEKAVTEETPAAPVEEVKETTPSTEVTTPEVQELNTPKTSTPAPTPQVEEKTTPTNSGSTGSSSAGRSGGYTSANTYPYGQCTWGVKGYFGSRVGNNWGNAINWPGTAAALGHVVDGNPVAGSTIAVTSDPQFDMGYGHVSVVLSVSGDSITIGETNYMGSSAWHTRTISRSSVIAFIHV